jgi:hypothetical protein
MGRDLQAIAGTEGVVNGDPAVNIDPLLDQEMAPRSPGIRGVFELTWEVPEARRNHLVSTMADELPASAEEARGSWTLWWRALPNLPPPPPPPGSPESARPIQETDVPPPPPPPIKLASGLRTCKWEAVRSGDKFSRLSATAWDDLPAYMSLEIETQTGQWNQWMFEVTGTKGGEPGSPIQSPAGPRNGGGPGQAQPAQPDTPGAAPLITPGRPVKSTGPSGSASKTTGGAKQ